MKKVLAFGVAAALGIGTLVLSANGQQQSPDSQSSHDVVRYGQSAGTYQSLLTTTYPGGYANPSETEPLAKQLVKAKTDADREKIRAKLNDVLEKQFDERQAKHKKESEALEEQVKKLKELIATRNENRKEIVSRRLEQIERDAKGLGW